MAGGAQDEIRFGGVFAGASGEGSGTNGVGSGSSAEAGTGGPTWWQVMERAFLELTSTEENRQLYGDPQEGATIEQAWRTRILVSGRPPVCLVAGDRPAVTTAAIRRVHELSARELVEALARLLGSPTSRQAAQIFYHDGETGHSVTLLGYDPVPGAFEFHDPWPGRSLLCAENNPAGVSAKPSARNHRRWTITADELRRVIVVAFVEPATWADLTGTPFRLTYGDLQASDFWSFFHLSEYERRAAEEGRVRIRLLTGGFRNDLVLRIVLDEREDIRHAETALRRPWVTGPPFGVNPLALDFAGSFLTTFVPAPDQSQIAPLADALRRLCDPRGASTLPQDKELWDVAGSLLMAYMDGPDPYVRLFEYSHVEARNVTDAGEDWLFLIVESG